ncbi:MAG: hypothetical protein ABEJ34_04695 [Haloferacaceae archaeon]
MSLCQVCGGAVADRSCPVCGATVCPDHFHDGTGVCVDCADADADAGAGDAGSDAGGRR